MSCEEVAGGIFAVERDKYGGGVQREGDKGEKSGESGSEMGERLLADQM